MTRRNPLKTPDCWASKHLERANSLKFFLHNHSVHSHISKRGMLGRASFSTDFVLLFIRAATATKPLIGNPSGCWLNLAFQIFQVSTSIYLQKYY